MHPAASPKNIIVCCDGTGNEFGDNNSNVVKIYTSLIIDAEQVGYYHPGVGTMGSPNRSTWFGRLESQIAGLAFGGGFMDNLGNAYKYLMDHYSDGDRIYLFGFSRGAYTVRALAGALHLYGLLCPGNDGHLAYLLRMYSQASRAGYNDEKKRLDEDRLSRAFKATFSRVVTIHFMGIWDTVSSVGWVYDPIKLLFDGQNPIVRKGRHAVSIDEHRCFFQDNLWGDPLPPHETPLLDEQQDLVQAWFPGVHSDVGGSYSQSDCAPSEEALRWMMDEAEDDGLIINPVKKAAVFGTGTSPGAEDIAPIYSRPAHAMSILHESLTLAWMPLELFPHKYFDGAGKKHWQIFPWKHRREIPDGSLFHPIVKQYLDHYGEYVAGGYQPPNLDRSKLFPLSESPLGKTVLPVAKVADRLAEQGFSVYRLNTQGATSLSAT